MLHYVIRRILYNIPVFLSIILFVMLALRVHDPVHVYLGKNASQAEIDKFHADAGLDQPFHRQYAKFVGNTLSLDFSVMSWDRPGKQVGTLIRESIGPSLAITFPALVFTTLISIVIGLVSAYYRGKSLDRGLVTMAVIGMSVSFLVYIMLGQYFGAFVPAVESGRTTLAVQGYDTSTSGWWLYYCLLPVMISTLVSMGYDTRFYRAVMVEESTKDYIRTARAKGIPERRVMFVHLLRNAMISIITRIMITLPLLITGSILLEMYFNIPGMGKVLITAINAKDFPVVQAFTAIFAVLFILSNILTDVLYAAVDPRIRLS